MTQEQNPYCEETVASMTDEQLKDALTKQEEELRLAHLLKQTIQTSIDLLRSERTKRVFDIPIGSVIKWDDKLGTVVGYDTSSLIAKQHKKDGSVGEREIRVWNIAASRVEIISKP